MKDTIKPNAFKIDFNENEFIISFADMEDEDQIKKEIDIKFLPEQIMSVIAPLIASVVEYQNKFGVDLGINNEEG